MTTQDNVSAPSSQQHWLRTYYFARAAFSVLWVLSAYALGRSSFPAAAILLVIYPAWDAAANYVDAGRTGGLARNRTQAINVVVSLATTLAVVLALQVSMNWVLGVFGVWAILSGLLQLGTAIRRWKSAGAQWVMILSGAQSALAGAFFIVTAQTAAVPSITNIAGYAAVGAVYFLISAIWLTVKELRQK